MLTKTIITFCINVTTTVFMELSNPTLIYVHDHNVGKGK